MFYIPDYIYKYAKDLSVRVLSLLVTTAIILFDSESRVKEYIIIVSVFNIAVVLFNFGGQFYLKRSEVFVRKINRIHIFAFLSSLLLYFLPLDFKSVFSAICLGICYSKLNEFSLRRQDKYKKIFLFSIAINFPRILSYIFNFDYSIATLTTGILFFVFFIINGNKEATSISEVKLYPEAMKKEKTNSILNYAFLTSIVYVVYQQLPSIMATSDLSEAGRYDQILSRLIFAFLFLKSSFVMMLIKSKKTPKLNWLGLVLAYFSIISVIVLLDNYKNIDNSVLSIIAVLIFMSSEVIFSFISARRHREYSYKEFLIDNLVLLSSSIVCMLMDVRLLLTYMISSVALLLLRSRHEFD